jgi:hypothetical protein
MCARSLALSAAIGVGVAVPAAMAGPWPNAPDPGGDPDAIVPVPPTGEKIFGFHENSWDMQHSHGWNAEELAAVVKGGGANSMRFHINWEKVEPEPDVWSEPQWDHYDRMYDALQAQGIDPLLTLIGSAPWARDAIYQSCTSSRSCEYPPGQWADPQWAEFTAEVARRYPNAAAIEIWNELNLKGFWKPEPNPIRYAQLVRTAYTSIKGVDPDMKVLAGALAPAPNTVRDILGQIEYMGMGEFLTKAYAASPSIKNYSDAVSFHTVQPEVEFGATSHWANAFQTIRTVKAAAGDAAKKIWLTETGLTLGSPDVSITRAQQAAGLLEQYRRVMTMPDVQAMYIHTLGDRLEIPFAAERAFGVIDSFDPFVPRPAYCVFAGRVDTATPFGGCEKISEGTPDPDPDPDPDPVPDPEPDPDPDPDPLHGDCSVRMAVLRWIIINTDGEERRSYKAEYRRTERECVPCTRRVARLKERAHERHGAARMRLLARARSVKQRCAPCRSTLRALENAAATASEEEMESLIRQHDGLRTQCKGRKTPSN